jgi:hypothetical protein
MGAPPGGGMGGGMGMGGPGMGGGGFVMPPPPAGLGGGSVGPTIPGGPPAMGALPAGPRGTVPEISSERRPGMPMASSLNVESSYSPNDTLSIEEIETRIAHVHQLQVKLEADRRNRQATAASKKREVISAEEPEEKIEWDHSNPRVIRLPDPDKVVPLNIPRWGEVES